jgi:acetoacetyl-CoA synthetase
MASQRVWQPSAERVAAANLTAFAGEAAARWNRVFPDYAA